MSIVDKYVRNEDGHFVCPHCEKVEEKQNTMYYHIKSIHEMDFPFLCRLCKNEADEHPRFLQKCGWYHHLATLHPENPHPSLTERNPYANVRYVCPTCEHASHTKANVLIHYARNHCKEWIPTFTRDIKTTGCTGCTRLFESSSAYLYHALNCAELRVSATPDHINNISRIR